MNHEFLACDLNHKYCANMCNICIHTSRISVTLKTETTLKRRDVQVPCDSITSRIGMLKQTEIQIK
jgi:hypothetical protein